MFGCLYGGKFSRKCKHCIKCISSRVELIRKKRLATVRVLKKDVADLLASGHDLNAFGRIEALIVEINHTSCYDMIEEYCQCILNQLSSLQKQRECPAEAMEAVSTLIFAAARFSDLPELHDLRGVFTKRYGSHMESSVNAQFVEKFQKKSFTTEWKLRLMKDIAVEFSIRWDSKAFQQKLSNPPAAPSDQSMIRKSVELRCHSEMKGRNAVPNLQKEVVFDDVVEANGRKRPVINAGGSFNGRKEAVFDDDLNRTVLNEGGAANSRKEEVFIADEAVYGRDRIAPNVGGGSFSRRKEEVSTADIALNGRTKTAIDSDVAVDKRNEASFSNNDDQEVEYKERWKHSPRTSVQKQVHPEPKVIHVIPVVCNGPSRDPSEKPRKFYTASKETENVEPIYDNAASRARAKDMGTQNEIVNDGVTCSGSPIAQHGTGLIGLERQHVGPVICREVKAVNMIPPHNKFKVGRNEGGDADSVPLHAELPKSEQGLDPPLRPVNSQNARPMSMIPPPYTKPNFKKPSADADDTKLMGAPINISSAADYERSDGGENAEPVSVRRQLPKPPLVIKTNNVIDNSKPRVELRNDRRTEETVHRPWKSAGEEIHGAFNRDRNLHGTSNGQRKHGGRGSNAMYDGDCEEEEEVVDRLLMHLSKKGVNNDIAKRRTRTRAPPTGLVADATADGEHYASGRNQYRPERVASLPPEPKSPLVEVGIRGRGPSRATSMQLGMSVGANARIPDYDDLTARFNALKRT